MGSKMLYSVFVGHLPPETTKRELQELFSNCGNVVDLFINENEKGGPYKYGFVRYKELDSAVQAMKELNRWKVRGEAIVVDMSKDTRERIEREKLQTGDRLMTKETKKPTDLLQVPRVKSSEFINDVMYLSRLKENCASLNFEVSKQKAGLTEKGEKTLREMDASKVLDYIARTEKGRPKTTRGQVSEQPSLESVRDKLLQSDDVNDIEAKERADKFMSVLNDVMETISMFVSDTNTDMKKQQKNQSLSDQVSKQLPDKKSENNGERSLSKSSSGMFSQSSDSCDDYSGQKLVGVGAREKHDLSYRTGASIKSINSPDSDSSSLSSDDDLDHKNRDSGVELDSSTNKFTSKCTTDRRESSFSRQSSDEMPSLEVGESLLQQLGSTSGKQESSRASLDSNLSEKESRPISQSVSQEREEEQSFRLKRQTKSDGDLIASKQNSTKSAQSRENENFLEWVVNKLKKSEIDENENKEDKATGGSYDSRNKMLASSQFQTYYLKAILGRGRGINPPKSQTDDYWVKGGRWGRGHT